MSDEVQLDLTTPDSHPEKVVELSPDITVASSEGLSTLARLDTLERRVDDIIRAQAQNAGIFRAALERMINMREQLHSHANSLQRLEAIATKAVVVQETNAASVAELVTFLKHAKTWGGWAHKNWPRLATFLLGIAIAKGYISAENGQNFLHLIGL